ncbi:MAG: aldo/keto reductase [Solirubrobacteraceae bacterium]
MPRPTTAAMTARTLRGLVTPYLSAESRLSSRQGDGTLSARTTKPRARTQTDAASRAAASSAKSRTHFGARAPTGSMSLPENQRKLKAVPRHAVVAGEASASLVELTIAFVVNHPAVTSAIIGPPTMEQLDSQVPAADVTLTACRIDEIVQPGVNVNPADTSHSEEVLKPPLRRR